MSNRIDDLTDFTLGYFDKVIRAQKQAEREKDEDNDGACDPGYEEHYADAEEPYCCPACDCERSNDYDPQHGYGQP